MTALDDLDLIVSHLTSHGLSVNPVSVEDETGQTLHALMVDVTPGYLTVRRAAGASVHVTRTINVLAVSGTRDGCVDLAEQARDLLDGYRTGSPDGTIRDASYDGPPSPESSTHPTRWSKALAFTWTHGRKRHGAERHEAARA